MNSASTEKAGLKKSVFSAIKESDGSRYNRNDQQLQPQEMNNDVVTFDSQTTGKDLKMADGGNGDELLGPEVLSGDGASQVGCETVTGNKLRKRRSVSCEPTPTANTPTKIQHQPANAESGFLQHAQSVNAVGVLSVRQNIVPKTSPRISSGIPSSLSICSEIGARKRSPSGDGSLCSKEDRSISSKTPKIHISVCGRALFACSNGQLRELESLVKENPELINYQYPYCYCCYSCMHIAAKSGNLDIVHFLVKNGANLNAKDNWSTPLHLAAQAGHLEVTRQLKEMGADTSVLDAHGKRYCDYLPADNRRSHVKNSALKKLKTHNSKHNNGQNEDTHSVSSNQSQLSLISYNSLHNRFGTLRPIGRAVSDFLHRK